MQLVAARKVVYGGSTMAAEQLRFHRMALQLVLAPAHSRLRLDELELCPFESNFET